MGLTDPKAELLVLPWKSNLLWFCLCTGNYATRISIYRIVEEMEAKVKFFFDSNFLKNLIKMSIDLGDWIWETCCRCNCSSFSKILRLSALLLFFWPASADSGLCLLQPLLIAASADCSLCWLQPLLTLASADWSLCWLWPLLTAASADYLWEKRGFDLYLIPYIYLCPDVL